MYLVQVITNVHTSVPLRVTDYLRVDAVVRGGGGGHG